MSGDDLVDQVVLRWDRANRSGGLGPVAYSCPPAQAEQVYRMLRPALSGDRLVPTAMARVDLEDGRIAVVRRIVARDGHDRPTFQAHALVGDAGQLSLPISLGVGWSAWPSLDLPLGEVRGRLTALSAAEVRRRGKAAFQQLAGQLGNGQDLTVALLAEVLRRPHDRLWIVSDTDGQVPLIAMATVGRMWRHLPDTVWFQSSRWSYDTGVGDTAELVNYAFTRLPPLPPAVGASDTVLVAAEDADDLARHVACQLVARTAVDYRGLSELLERFNLAARHIHAGSQLDALADELTHVGDPAPLAPPRIPEPDPFVRTPEPPEPDEPSGPAEPVEQPPMPSPPVTIPPAPATAAWRRLTGPLWYRLGRREAPPTAAELRDMMGRLETMCGRSERPDEALTDQLRLLDDPVTLLRALRVTTSPPVAEYLVVRLSQLAVRLPRRQRVGVAAEVMAEGLWIDRWPDDPDRQLRRAALLYDTVVRAVPRHRLPAGGLAMIRALFRSEVGRDFVEGLLQDSRPTHWSDAMWRECLRLDREAVTWQRPQTLVTTTPRRDPPTGGAAGKLLLIAVVGLVVVVLLTVMVGCGSARTSSTHRDTGGAAVTTPASPAQACRADSRYGAR